MAEQENIEKLLSELKENENYWNKTIESISQRLSCSAKEVVSLQAETISVRQQISEQIKSSSYELYKLMPMIKSLKRKRFEYYSSNSAPFITNASEKMKLIEWEVAIYDYKKDILDSHIEFLRESQKNVDNINYAIKNKISLYQLTELE